MTQREILQKVFASGAAMSVLDSQACAVAEGRPPLRMPDGTLQYDDEGNPVDAGSPVVTLGDLIREAVG